MLRNPGRRTDVLVEALPGRFYGPLADCRFIWVGFAGEGDELAKDQFPELLGTVILYQGAEQRRVNLRATRMRISKPHIYLENWIRGSIRDPWQHFSKRTRRTCPICAFTGYFVTANRLPESRCPNCSSKERDRVFQLSLQQNAIDVTGKKILHFSPERPFWRRWRHLPGYVSGDVKKNKVANTQIDITKIQFDDHSFDLLVCHHVLEHVPNDKLAMAECFRVLRSGGTAFFSVPLRDGSAETFEPPASMPKEEVERICGWDHKRIYGQDFPGKLRAAGFSVSEVEFSGAEAEQFQLRSNLVDGQSLDRVFVARK